MNEFLLEIYGEEIPSSAQAIAKNDLKDLFVNFLKNEKINFSSIETFATARRITVIIKGLRNNEVKLTKEIRGPSTSAEKKAIEGFLKSQGIKYERLLFKKTVKGKEYFFFEKKIKQKSLIILVNLLLFNNFIEKVQCL